MQHGTMSFSHHICAKSAVSMAECSTKHVLLTCAACEMIKSVSARQTCKCKCKNCFARQKSVKMYSGWSPSLHVGTSSDICTRTLHIYPIALFFWAHVLPFALFFVPCAVFIALFALFCTNSANSAKLPSRTVFCFDLVKWRSSGALLLCREKVPSKTQPRNRVRRTKNPCPKSAHQNCVVS